MWAPADRYALPSEEDMVHAKHAICDLKNEIIGAQRRVAEAQRHLDDLTKNLNDLEAWLSPVRRLSVDALGIIFVKSAEDDWISPLRVASVCRVWRHAALSTPRAWSYINFQHEWALKLLPTFLERSGRLGLHIGLAKMFKDADFAAVAQMADRVQCLSVPNLSIDIRGVQYPILERLRITNETSPRALLQLTRSLFPALRHLEFAYHLTPDLLALEAMEGLPPLQSLRLSVQEGIVFFHMARKCSETLTCLDLYINSRTQFPRKYTLTLPQLRALSFYDARTWDVYHDIVLHTPQLRTLNTNADYTSKTFTLHLDLDKTTHLRVRGEQYVPPLTSLRRLRVMQLAITTKRFLDTLKSLLQEPSLCPELEAIEFLYPARLGAQYKVAEKTVSDINSHRKCQIRFTSTVKWREELPGIVDAACGIGMPCNT